MLDKYQVQYECVIIQIAEHFAIVISEQFVNALVSLVCGNALQHIQLECHRTGLTLSTF